MAGWLCLNVESLKDIVVSDAKDIPFVFVIRKFDKYSWSTSVVSGDEIGTWE